jgi:hypothetical protein
MELLRHAAARVPGTSANMVAELEWERMGLAEDRNRLQEELAGFAGNTWNCWRENAAQLEERLAEESVLRQELQERMEVVTAQQTAYGDACGQLEAELESSREDVRSLQNELHREKTLHAEYIQELRMQESAVRAQWEEAVREKDALCCAHGRTVPRKTSGCAGELAHAQDSVAKLADLEITGGAMQEARSGIEKFSCGKRNCSSGITCASLSEIREGGIRNSAARLLSRNWRRSSGCAPRTTASVAGNCSLRQR